MLTSSTPRVNRRGNVHGIDFFLRDQGSKLSLVLGLGIKILGKKMGSFVKKYTSLLPCNTHNKTTSKCPVAYRLICKAYITKREASISSLMFC